MSSLIEGGYQSNGIFGLACLAPLYEGTILENPGRPPVKKATASLPHWVMSENRLGRHLPSRSRRLLTGTLKSRILLHTSRNDIPFE
jgi:hypothetical protein